MPPRPRRSSFASALENAWYRPGPVPLTWLLLPLALLWRAVAGARRILAAAGIGGPVAGALRVPVVVVGNLTVGGAGKTPLVRSLVESLRSRGWRPGVVSRGYGGAARGPLLVDATSDWRVVGDEALLYAADATPAAVGRDRVAAAQALLAAHPDLDVIIADDGLQHLALGRAVELVVIDAARGFGNGWTLPAGPLRESASRLASIDAVVWNGASGSGEARLALGPARRQFRYHLEGETWVSVADPLRRCASTTLRGPGVHAVAGIGNPERFFATLHRLGIEATPHPFADHHAFSPGDLGWPGARSILMTEKDAVKCRGWADERCWYLPVRAVADPALTDFIEERLRGSQAARNPGLPGHQGATGLRP